MGPDVKLSLVANVTVGVGAVASLAVLSGLAHFGA